jgi:hypothetical protein
MDATSQPSPGAAAPPSPVPTGEGQAGRLPVRVVEHLHRLLGGDPRVEGMVLRFIVDRYGAKNLFYLPPHVATAIMRRPADFIQAAKNHCEPELTF